MKSLKIKGGSFFSKERWKVIRDVVVIVNDLTMKATMLAKAYYLQKNSIIALDKRFYDLCFKVILNQKLQFRPARPPKEEKDTDESNKPKKEKVPKNEKDAFDIKIYNELKTLFQDYFNNAFVDLKDYSISQIISMAASDLETAILNNIEFHYIKYVNRYLYLHLYKTVTNNKAEIAHLRNHVLYNYPCPSKFEKWISEHKQNIVPSREIVSFDSDLTNRPWVYLNKMVNIIATLEDQYPKTLKMLSPIILRRTFIPKYIHIDTNALVQLLMTSKDINTFVQDFKLKHNVDLNIKTKGDLGNKFDKIFKRAPMNPKEEFMFQQEYWKYLCNFETSKKSKQCLYDEKRKLYFGNSIVTDGCSICFSIVEENELKKKTFANRKLQIKSKEDPFLKRSDVDLLNSLFLSADPGKEDLVAITDGKNIIKYTKSQRHQDTKRDYFLKQSTIPRNKTKVNLENKISVKDYEEAILSLCNSKSCNFKKFIDWCTSKLKYHSEMKMCYETPRYRNNRFSRYTLVKSSEDKFLNRLDQFIKSVRPPQNNNTSKNSLASKLENKLYRTDNESMLSKDDIDKKIQNNIKLQSFKKVVILYGNWGRNPNLKNSAPTPGISLRRKIHSRFPTVTIGERNTSQTCPSCKTVSLKNPILTGPNRQVEKKHHLLRCQNENCECRWRWLCQLAKQESKHGRSLQYPS